MRCQESRKVIMAVARGDATDAERLRLDEHLNTCADCQKERAHWLLLQRLKEVPEPHLSEEAQRQLLARLTALASMTPSTASPAPALRYRPRAAVLMTFAAVAAVLMLLWWRTDSQLLQPKLPPPQAPAVIAQSVAIPKDSLPTLLTGISSDSVQIKGASLFYQAGTQLRVHERERRVELLHGEVEVDVTPSPNGTGQRFRVEAASFVVEVLGTRFRVSEDSVYTLHGRVRVLDPEGHQLAVLGAGQRWTKEPPQALPPEPMHPQYSAASSTSVTPTPKEHVGSAPASTPRPTTARQRIAQARSMLAAGNTALARQRITEAAAAQPTLTQRAAIGLIEAECLLSEQHYEQAIAAYRRVAEQYPSDSAGETAAFAVAQFLSERGDAKAARQALNAYLQRYPSGRFVREVTERLGKDASAP